MRSASSYSWVSLPANHEDKRRSTPRALPSGAFVALPAARQDGVVDRAQVSGGGGAAAFAGWSGQLRSPAAHREIGRLLPIALK